MKPLQQLIVQKAIELLKQGGSVREVSARLGISLGAVSRIRKDNEENIPAPKMGQPIKVSRSTQRYVARQFDIGKITTLRDGQRLIQSMDGAQVHIESVRNYLEREGLKGYIQQRKPGLTKEQIAKRLKFAQDHLHWTVEEWKNVMFSDETIISRMGSYGRKYYYKRPERKRLEAHHIKQTKQGGGGKMLIWGCMTYYGVGDACWYPDSMNSEGYLGVLKDYVLQTRDWYGIERQDFIFQQDNASAHKASIVNNYLSRMKIRVLDWPPNSPDMNPIEHLWAYIKQQLDRYPEAPKTMEELWERIQKIWIEIPIEIIHDLYESMPRRIKELHDNKGGLTRY